MLIGLNSPTSPNIRESAILEGSVASLSVNVSYERQDIYNGESDFDKPDHKAPIITLGLRPSVSQSRQLKCRYSSDSIPPMPPPTKWPVADESVVPLLARATIDAHKYYGVFRSWNGEGKRLGRTFPITVMLFTNETTDQYEAAFLLHTTPHPKAAR